MTRLPKLLDRLQQISNLLLLEQWKQPAVLAPLLKEAHEEVLSALRSAKIAQESWEEE